MFTCLISGPMPDVNFTTVHVVTPEPGLCRPVEYSMCAEIGFMFTSPQNPEDMEEVIDISESVPFDLIQTRCSDLLIPLTCAAHAPRCELGTGETSVPCREICRHVLKECKKTLKTMEIESPDILSCKQYPSFDDGSCTMGSFYICLSCILINSYQFLCFALSFLM